MEAHHGYSEEEPECGTWRPIWRSQEARVQVQPLVQSCAASRAPVAGIGAAGCDCCQVGVLLCCANIERALMIHIGVNYGDNTQLCHCRRVTA